MCTFRCSDCSIILLFFFFKQKTVYERRFSDWSSDVCSPDLFAGPYDIGIYGAVNNWFVARRAQAASIATLAQMLGLVAMPLIAHAAILADGWRNGWLAVGATVLIVGFVPNWLLVVRRPEDIGLAPDPQPVLGPTGQTAVPEPVFTRAAAMRTSTFWLLSLFTLLLYPVQAGDRKSTRLNSSH